jgi:hypothetical protein
MKVFNATGSGIRRSLKAWKGVLTVWFVLFAMSCMLALPVKSALRSGLGSSMITGRFYDGIDVEAVTDFMNNYNNISPYFFSGLFVLILTGLIVNAFITGGLFWSVRKSEEKFSISSFYSAGAVNFWSFFGITLSINFIFIILILFVVVLPVGLAAGSSGGSDKAAFIALYITGGASILVLAILLLTADYARAWQVTNQRKSFIKALGFGFQATSDRFLTSFPLMLILMLVQFLYSLLVIKLIGTWRPSSGNGVFLLLIISQLVFFIKLMLKTIRYASVTSLMELNREPVDISDQKYL